MNCKGKDLILRKCFELLVIKGFEAVSISDIQQATGLSRGYIYHYYKSKDELLMEVTELSLLELFRIDLEHIRDYTISDMIKHIEGMYQEIYNLKLSDGITNVSIVNYDFLFYQAVTRSDAFAKRYQKVRDEELMACIIVVKNSINNLELEKLLYINNVAKTFLYISEDLTSELHSHSEI